ncbi:Eukaryotic translation initiation factor eIF-1 [Kickxella alabastrina]|uniref:Eukaryotic translation initiation factor eIF-1 n=1 Tax=Kickxella alabastrina TaxID=61397 RepID=A0ACC1HZ61_9FUNG|nr:Eukaryotic translation initiation factor eIF-1 [Kickxella alabastrina]
MSTPTKDEFEHVAEASRVTPISADSFSDEEVVAVKKSSKKKKNKAVTIDEDLNNFGADEDFFSGKPGSAHDPFAEEKKDEVEEFKIHIRIQQRNGRKTVTTMQGLPEIFDHKKLVKYFKSQFACIGTVVADEEHGSIIQLSGDHRIPLKEFLISEGIANKNNVKVHGF